MTKQEPSNRLNLWMRLWEGYCNLSPNGKVMAQVMALHAITLPIGNTFVATYILRDANHHFAHAMAYQLGVYIGVIILSYANSYLLRRFTAKQLFICGITLSGLVLLGITLLPKLNPVEIVLSGIAMGLAAGFFWCNRNLLLQQSTSDHNRAGFYGFEMFFQSIFLVLTPALAGLLVTRLPEYGYFLLSLFVIFINIITLFLLTPYRATKESISFDYLPAIHDPLWQRVLMLDLIKGVLQAFLMILPAAVVMRNLGGNEAHVGAVQSIGGIISGFCVLWIGKRLSTRGQLLLLGGSALCFAAMSGWTAIAFNSYAFSWLLATVLLTQPLLDLGFFPIQMNATDRAKLLNGGSLYSYIAAHESAYFMGRLLSIMLFLIGWWIGGEMLAMRGVLPALAFIHILSYPLAISIAARIK